MPSVLLGEVLAYKHMSEVSAAVCALNLCALAIRVRKAFDGAGDFVVEAWPPAIRLKLVFGAVKFCAAAFADVGAFFPERVILPSERHFGAFVHDNLFFFRSKLFEVCLIFRS